MYLFELMLSLIWHLSGIQNRMTPRMLEGRDTQNVDRGEKKEFSNQMNNSRYYIFIIHWIPLQTLKIKGSNSFQLASGQQKRTLMKSKFKGTVCKDLPSSGQVFFGLQHSFSPSFKFASELQWSARNSEYLAHHPYWFIWGAHSFTPITKKALPCWIVHISLFFFKYGSAIVLLYVNYLNKTWVRVRKPN